MEEEATAWPKALGWEAAVTLEHLREAAMAESQLAARYAAETTQGPDQAEPGKALQLCSKGTSVLQRKKLKIREVTAKNQMASECFEQESENKAI